MKKMSQMLLQNLTLFIQQTIKMQMEEVTIGGVDRTCFEEMEERVKEVEVKVEGLEGSRGAAGERRDEEGRVGDLGEMA